MLVFLALATNARSAGCDPASLAEGLVISELLVDPEGSAPGQQWVELYNETGLDLDASGWRLESGATAYDTVAVFPPGTWLIDGEFLVAAPSSLPFATLVLPALSLGPALGDADALRLVDCSGAPVDTVVYGTPNTDGWTDDTGATAGSLAPAPLSGQPLARTVDGGDTDASGVDFVLSVVPTPLSSNTAAPVTCGGPGSGLLVNEVFDDGAAWVELRHQGAAPVLLEGWSLVLGTDALAPAYTFAAGQVAAPGARFVVGDAAEAVYPANFSLDGVGLVRLVDCAGFASDTLVIGPENPQGWLDDRGTAATSLSVPLAPSLSLSRAPDGSDTDDGADFALLLPTPAAENGTATPPDTDVPTTDTGSLGSETGTPQDTGPVGTAADPEPAPNGCGCGGIPRGPWAFAAAALVLRATGRRSPRRR